MKYECERNGSTEYNGRSLRYKKGVREYPHGSLDHVSSCTMISKQHTAVVEGASVRTVTPKPLEGTVKKIKKWLDDNDVEYPSTANKPELLDILENA